MLTYGLVVNACDEHFRIEEKTTTECLKHFVTTMQQIFEHEYIIQPSQVGIDKQMMINVEGGFFEMFSFWIVYIIIEKKILLFNKANLLIKRTTS